MAKTYNPSFKRRILNSLKGLVKLKVKVTEVDKGFKEIMNEFNSERCGNSAFCVGFAQGAYERALQYCKERVQF